MSTAFHEACTAVPWTWDRAGWWMASCRSSSMQWRFVRKHTETRSVSGNFQTLWGYRDLHRFNFLHLGTPEEKHGWNHRSPRNLADQSAPPWKYIPCSVHLVHQPCPLRQVDKRHMAETIKLQVWATMCCWKSCEQFAIASDCASASLFDTTAVVSLWSLRYRRVSRASSTTFRTEQIVYIAGSIYSPYLNSLGHTMSARSTPSR